jgi:hypothetical protein
VRCSDLCLALAALGNTEPRTFKDDEEIHA